MQPLVEYPLEIGGFDTRALELDGEGPPFVLLHGYADSADTWRLALDLLARRNRRAIALDLPGFAAAGPLDAGEPVLPQFDRFAAAAVERVAEEHGEVVLVGNSLGGCVALRAAQRSDLPVKAVVPVAPAGFDHPTWFRIIEANALLVALLRSPVPVPEAVVRSVAGQVYRALVFTRPRMADPKVIAAFTNHHRDRAAISRYLETGRRLLPELVPGCFQLESIKAPVLLVWGDRDRMVSHRGSRWILEALPHTTYEIFRGVGHCPQLEAPHRFVETVERFVANGASPTPPARSDGSRGTAPRGRPAP